MMTNPATSIHFYYSKGWESRKTLHDIEKLAWSQYSTTEEAKIFNLVEPVKQ